MDIIGAFDSSGAGPALADLRHSQAQPFLAPLDDDKIGRMGFWIPPSDVNRAIRKVEAEKSFQ